VTYRLFFGEKSGIFYRLAASKLEAAKAVTGDLHKPAGFTQKPPRFFGERA
jgi:hypothetical protein